jgi:acyl-CoA dehydrogenase
MTEPGTGSDLQAVKTTAVLEGNQYRINGSKTFITNGQNAELVLLVAKTDPAAGAKGVSLILVDTRDAPGFRRGRNLDKIGRDMADTSELFFDDVRVPTSCLLGPVEGKGFVQLMEKLPQERLILAVQCVAAMEYALAQTIVYVKERRAFGQSVIDFQNTQFKLAELKTEATIAKVFVDHCVERHLRGELDSATASMAKYWTSDLLNKLCDECLQLHGGYGYMNEYPIAQAWKDARVTRIYGGTNEIMKLLIARTL